MILMKNTNYAIKYYILIISEKYIRGLNASN